MWKLTIKFNAILTGVYDAGLKHLHVTECSCGIGCEAKLVFIPRDTILAGVFVSCHVLSHLLALRNTVLGKSTRVGADYQNVTVN